MPAAQAPVRPAGTQGARGEPGPMKRQTDGNGRRDRRRGDPRIGRPEGAGKGKPGSCASISPEGWPRGEKSDQNPFGLISSANFTLHPSRIRWGSGWYSPGQGIPLEPKVPNNELAGTPLN